MTILRDDPKTLWKRRNDQSQNHEIVLTTDINDRVTFKNLCSFWMFDLTEDQFFEMCQAGAEHFCKQITIEDLPISCPLCQGKTYQRNNHSNFQRICTRCHLAGPLSDSTEEADEGFMRIVIVAKEPDYER